MNATVYRFYAENGDLLYVGCTMRLAARIGEHTAGKSWWGEVTRATFDHFDNQRAALIAEARAIATEHPVHNTAGKLTTWPNDDERGARADQQRASSAGHRSQPRANDVPRTRSALHELPVARVLGAQGQATRRGRVP